MPTPRAANATVRAKSAAPTDSRCQAAMTSPSSTRVARYATAAKVSAMRAHRKTRRRFSVLVLRPRPRSVISVVTSSVMELGSSPRIASSLPEPSRRSTPGEFLKSCSTRRASTPHHRDGALRSIGPFNRQASGLMAGFGAPALFRGGGLGVLACDCDASRRRLQARKASSHPRPRRASSSGRCNLPQLQTTRSLARSQRLGSLHRLMSKIPESHPKQQTVGGRVTRHT